MTQEQNARPCPQCGITSPKDHQYCPGCGFPIGTLGGNSEDRFIGQTLPGGYHILDLISVGGMGRIYRAEQSVLGRTVAVKIIHPHLLSDENAALRFLTEARAASQLNHPNSIAVYDFGTKDGQPYLVMEFLRGKDLARAIYEDGPLPISRITNVLMQVLAALAEAHELGIIHRDLKPENIILEPLRRGGDFVKVLDFGLAKLRADAHAPTNVTSPGIVCGTPDYMAPEQGRGDPIDGRSDLYAVGVVLFQLLTGRLPFEADSPTHVVMMHLTVPVPDPREIAPQRNIPNSIVDVVYKALQKDVSRRYQDALEFADALREAQSIADSYPPSGRRSLPPSPSARPMTSVACTHCGLVVPAGRFCLECGTRLSNESLPPVRSSQVQLPLVLLSRDTDWEWLVLRQQAASRELAGGRLVGETGAGKTRLLHDYLRQAETAGAMVIVTGPDPYHAEVPCYALRDTIEQLVVLDIGAIESDRDGSLSASVRAGLLEIFERTVPRAADNDELRRNRRDALLWALNQALLQFSPEIVVLAIDDLHRIDKPSRETFADILSDSQALPVLVLTTHTPEFDSGWPTRYPVRSIEGLPSEIASRLLKSARAETPVGLLSGSPVLPLFVDQLLRFAQEGGTNPPAKLADVLAQRVAMLAPNARHTLQALSVLGDRVSPALVSEFLPKSDNVTDALAILETRGMIWSSGDSLSIDHPLLRDVVLAGIPAEARRELHGRSLAIMTRTSAPLEARAQTAFYAEDSFEALLLLEQVAERAAARNDTEGEVLALRRGLDLARREISRGELDDPLRAVVIFGRKLGAALTRASNYSDAEGVLREALDCAGPTNPETARLLGALALVARGRERNAEARQQLESAIEAARRSGDHELEAAFMNTRMSWFP
jgi:serine/threonine protein kinase